MNRSLRLVAFAAFACLGFAGCASTDEDSSEGQQESDVTAGSCQWSGPGNAKYKDAVAASKSWRDQECEVLQVDAIRLAQDAVAICSAVGPLIAESKWAGDLRTALGPLELAYLAGDLEGDEDGALNADAVGEALVGQTFWAAGQGAYGPPRIVHLGNGTYELERVVSDDEGVTIERRVTGGGTWSASSDVDGSVLVTFAPEEGTDEADYVGGFRLERWEAWQDLDLFRIVPADGSLDEYATQALYAANISECDA